MMFKVSALVAISGVLGLLMPAPALAGPNPENPPGYYSIYWPWIDPPFTFDVALQKIDTATGQGTYMASLQLSSQPGPGLPDLFPTPFGLAFDTDGTAYTMVNWMDFVSPDNSYSQLAKINMLTGELTYIGPLHNLNFAGPDIDGCGDLYVTGFEVGDPAGGPPVVFGDSYLYRIHKKTGEATRIGDTGSTKWMDLAFDSKGRLWATYANELWQIDPRTGASTFVTPILGVPQSEIPGTCSDDWPYMEVMSIAFDEKDVLWATAMRGFSWCVDINSPVMRIDVDTGIATVVGYTNQEYNHGGDIVGTKSGGCRGKKRMRGVESATTIPRLIERSNH